MNILEQIQTFLTYSVLNISFGRFLAALAIFLVIFTFRSIFLKVCTGFFRRVAARTKTTLDDQIINIIEQPARLFLAVIGLWAAFEYMQLPEDAAVLVNHFVRTLFAFALFWAAFKGTTVISGMFQKLALRTETRMDDQLVHFVGKFLRIAVIMVGAMVIVREWGYDIAGLVAGLGIGGLAVALAAKETVSNIFGSITILLDRPFSVGDWIETPTVEGIVEDIHLRSTRIRSFSNALITVPNSIVANDAITNWSRMKKRRISFKLGVTYSTKSAQMEKCINEIRTMLENHSDVHPDMIFVYFTDFGDSALEIFLYFFTKTIQWQEYLKVRQMVNLK
jgi:MscS family membrane protein